jgi:hypothetical protein
MRDNALVALMYVVKMSYEHLSETEREVFFDMVEDLAYASGHVLFQAQPDDTVDDGEDRWPHNSWDLSDDADALASAGWGTDEDYGYYE